MGVAGRDAFSLATLRQRLWQRNRGKRQVNGLLLAAAGAVAALAAAPLVYILLRAVAAEPEAWERLAQARLAGLLANTLALTLTVSLGAAGLGVALAWLVERTDLPGRAIWRWLLALPLALPAFVGAVVHVSLWRPRGGLVPVFLRETWGLELALPSPFGFGGAAFMLTLFMYPYVYVLSAAAFRSLPAALEEAARSLGRNLWQTLWEVTLPALRPGITAGALLVALDVLAEYGTVALLRYETFSAAIFLQLSGRYDRSAAAILSGVLVLIALAALAGELRLQGRARLEQMGGHWRPAPLVSLGAGRWPAGLLVLGVALAAVVVPLAWLVWWTARGLGEASAYRVDWSELGGYWWNSLWSAGLAAAVAVALSVPVAYFAVRYPRLTSRVLAYLSQVGYALPGVVVALSLTLFTSLAAPGLRAWPLVVVLAYVVRHMPQAVRSSQAALVRLAPALEEAARSLGRSPLRVLLTVTLPLVFPGLLAGAALVFLTSLKELPATLLLRPAGFDTLAVRVWLAAGDGIYTQAAPPALLLTLCAALPLVFLLRRGKI